MEVETDVLSRSGRPHYSLRLSFYNVLGPTGSWFHRPKVILFPLRTFYGTWVGSVEKDVRQEVTLSLKGEGKDRETTLGVWTSGALRDGRV